MPSLPEFAVPKRRVWPLFAVIAVLVAGGAFLLWQNLTAPFPLRVLVAVDVDGYWWEGSQPAAQLADELGEALSQMGFDPVRAGDPETAAILEDAESIEAAAKTLRAAFIIRARLAPEVVTLPVDGGFFEVRIDAPVIVTRLGEDKPLVERIIHTFSGAKERERALGLAAESAARHAFDVALPAMVSHESVASIISGVDAKLVDQLAPAVRFVGAREAELGSAAGRYKDLDAARRAEEGGAAVTFHSGLDAEDSLLAVGDGRILISSGPVAPFYSPIGLELLRDTGLETVAWRKLDGDAVSDDVLWRGYNCFTYPTATRDGATIALVEDLYGWSRALTIAAGGPHRGNGARPLERLRVDGARKLSEPKISPGGRALAYADRACADCPKEIAVLDMVSKKELWRLTPEDAAQVGTFAWLDDERLMAIFQLSAPKDEEPAEMALWGIDVRDGRRFTLMVARDGAVFGHPTASADARTVVVAHQSAGAIVSLDVASNALQSHAVGGRASSPALSADGRRVVFELTTAESPDAEIALLDLSTSVVTPLTQNQSADHYPLFSSDGKRVFFEARDADPVFPRKRTVARIASVPLP